METIDVPPYLPSLGRLLGFASGSCNALSQKLLDAHDLSLTHWVILTALWRRDGMTISEVARYYRVNDPAASRVIDRMVDKGLVARSADPADRRVSRIFLTEKARALAHLIDFYKEINAILLKGFSDEEAKALCRMLERIGENAANGIRNSQTTPKS